MEWLEIVESMTNIHPEFICSQLSEITTSSLRSVISSVVLPWFTMFCSLNPHVFPNVRVSWFIDVHCPESFSVYPFSADRKETLKHVETHGAGDSNQRRETNLEVLGRCVSQQRGTVRYPGLRSSLTLMMSWGMKNPTLHIFWKWSYVIQLGIFINQDWLISIDV